MSATVQMQAKGSLTLPAELRRKYGFEDGDVFSLVDVGDGSLLIVPRPSVVPKLVAEMSAIREDAGVDLDDMLDGSSDERRRLFEERYGDRE